MKAAIYTRFSTDKQQSTQAQIDRCVDYAKDNKMTIYNVYSDEDATGTNTNRPQFNTMVSDAGKKRFDAVIVYDVSRASRDVVDWFDFRKTMSHLDVQVLSATQEIGDILDSSHFLTELITVGLGQHMVLQTREKSIDGKKSKAKQGLFMGGNPPLGYDVVGRKYIINEAEAKVVRLIFKMYADGHGYNYIIDNLKGYKTKAGRPFGKGSLHSILRNERYIGIFTYDKMCERKMHVAVGRKNKEYIKIPGVVPRIIDDVTWERVCRRVNDNTRNAKNKAKREYLLSGLIECVECGNKYIGHTSTNSKGYESACYCCGNKYRTHECNAKNINLARIEEFVTVSVLDYLKNKDLNKIAKEIADLYNSSTVDLSKERKELAEVETKINNGVKAILSGIELPELEFEIDNLKMRKSELDDIIAFRSSGQLEVRPEDILEKLNSSASLIDSDIDRAIKNCVQKIYAYPNGSYTVELGVHLIGSSGRA